MLSLKFLELKLDVKNVLIENIGILGVFMLKAFNDRLTLKDISDITGFDEELLLEEINKLQKRGYLETKRLTSKGLKIIKIYEFLNLINNSSIIIDLYLEDFYFINKNYLSSSPAFKVYPQKIFDYGILKKLNNHKDRILSQFDKNLSLKDNYEYFELNYYPIKNYFVNFDQIVFGGNEFKIGEKVFEIVYDVRNLKGEKVSIFENFYFSLYSGQKYRSINEYKGKVFLPIKYSVENIDCDQIKIEKICLLNISIKLKEKINTKFIDIERMIKGISEDN